MSKANLIDDAPADPGEAILAPAATIARMLGISERTVWRLLSAGQIVHPVRIGGSVRWRVTAVEEWIAAGCPAPGRWEG